MTEYPTPGIGDDSQHSMRSSMEVWKLIDFITGLHGLVSQYIFGEIYSYGVFG